MKKRLLAMMMAIVMAMSLLPMSVFAAYSTSGDLQAGDVRANKALVLDGNGNPVVDEDGYYTVQIAVQGKPVATEKAANVVLCIDVSNSMTGEDEDGDGYVVRPDQSCNGWIVEDTEWQWVQKNGKHGPHWVFEKVVVGYYCSKCGHEWGLNDHRPDNGRCDQGGSEGITRLDIAKSAALQFISELLGEELNIQVAVVAFGGHVGGEKDTYLNSIGLTTNQSNLENFVNDLKTPEQDKYIDDYDGGTNYTSALAKARDLLSGQTGRDAYILFLSDGKPAYTSDKSSDTDWNGTNQAQDLINKKGVTIYTGGIAIEEEDSGPLRAISSKDSKNNDLYQTITLNNMASDLANLMKVVKEATFVAAGKNAVITDVVNTDDFDYIVTPTAGVTESSGTVTWTIGDITESTKSIEIKVKPKDGKYGDLYTNESVELSYTDYNNQSVTIRDTKDDTDIEIGNPYITIQAPTPVTAEYTVEYYYETVKGTAPEGAPEKGEANVGDTVTITAGDTAGDKMFPKKTQVGTTKYAFDEGAENVLSKAISATEQNVLKVYYALDANGDGTPDKYQAFVKFESFDSNGEVTGTGISQVFTFKDTTTGKYLTSGSVTPSLKNVTTVPVTGYTFDYWTKDEETDNKVDPSKMIPNVKGGTTITFKAHWKLHTIDVTFDANGGAWNEGTTIDGYILSDNDTKATDQKTTNDTVKAITGPTCEGMKFKGWGVKLDSEGKPSDEITPFYALSIGNGVSVSALQAVFGESPIIFYAMWEASTSPVEKLNYTIHQHYMGSDGKQVAQFNDKLPKTAPSGTSITSLFDGKDQNQTYEGQTYIYLASETKIKVGENTTPVTDGTNLTANGTEIHLYYYLDAWKAKDDSETGGDGTADIYQVRVKYEAAKEEGTVTPALEILTIPGNAASGSVNPDGSTATAAPGYAFDYWQENGTDVKTYEKVLDPAERTATGGSTITFTAYFDVDTKGKIEAGKETGDGIPDKYQAFVKFISANEEQGSVSGDTYQVFTFANHATTGDVTPVLSGDKSVNVTPAENYAFDIWTKDKDKNAVNPAATMKNVVGNTTIIFKANFAEDKINEKDPTAPGSDGIPDKYQAVVTYKVVGGTWSDKTIKDQIYVFKLKIKNAETGDWENVNPAPTLGDTIPTGMISKYSNTASQSWDKEIDANTPVIGNVTYTYTFTQGSTGGGGGNHKPPVLNKEDHYAYIVGYPDGTVKPQGNITRAEVATIFFRMLTDDSRNEFWSQTNSYRDVSEGQWFNNAISTLANAGILSGYPDGTFRPNAPITRAEFTKIAASFFERVEYTIDNPFNDVDDDDWFYKFVMAAYEGGLITGYPEGDFRPNANISRAESVTIVNRTLERAPDADHFLKDMIVWPDNAENAWYYEAVQEATNSHEYVVKGTGTNKYEEWTKILEVRDWPALEKDWSNANSATGGEVVK